jgi:hypothetical protein
MRWRSVSLTACSGAAALFLAGCGGGERLPVTTAVRLDRLAANHQCATLIRETIAAVNRHEVPPSLQETLVSEANRCRFPRPFRP